MAITANTDFTPVEFVSDLDSDQDNPTVYELTPLNGLQHMEVMTHSVRDAEGNTWINATGMRKAIACGLTGWRNFPDKNGNDVQFNPGNIEKIPGVVLSEIAQKIIDISELGEAERKNS